MTRISTLPAKFGASLLALTLLSSAHSRLTRKRRLNASPPNMCLTLNMPAIHKSHRTGKPSLMFAVRWIVKPTRTVVISGR